MSDLQIKYCFLNLAANPHPSGIYPRLFEISAKKQINFRGDNYATITPPTKDEKSNFYHGALICWTEIDASEPGIDKTTFEEKTIDELKAIIPKNVGFNSKIFLYILDENTHTIVVEVKNEHNKTISARQVGKIFSDLFSGDIIESMGINVEVTVIPAEGTLDKILSMAHLQRLKIHLVRPNPDDIFEPAGEVLRAMEKEGVGSLDATLVASSRADGLDVGERTKSIALTAEKNGYVEGAGKQSDGSVLLVSTKDHPKIVSTIIPEGQHFLQEALSAMRSFTK